MDRLKAINGRVRARRRTRQPLGAAAGRSLRRDLAARYRVNSAIALLDAVHSGAGFALQPCWMVDEALRQGTLVRLLPRWTGPAQTAHIVHAPRRRLPMRVQAVMEYLVAAVRTW
jgi:DNA-binding transcriptional LysR family regulator